MKLENVSICFEKQIIIDAMNLDIQKGKIFVLMGPSGSGKTTLLKGIAGLLPLSSGILKWNNDKGKTGIVFQDPRLFPHMTVIENLAFGLRAKGIAKKERNNLVNEFLQILQLEGLEKRFPHQLSGGQQQRVSLGRVLVLKPDLLLLDEPFAALDTPLRIQLTEWLYQLQRKQGFSILWVTHYLDEAFSVADRVGVIMNGKLRQVGKPQDFYQKPWSENVAAFFALKNRFSFSQWNKWFPNGFQHLETDDMGWIPANALFFLTDGQVPKIMDDFAVKYLDGIVARVKHETKGHIIAVETKGECLEIELDVWEEVPAVGSQVKVGVPLNKIIWYPKDDH